MVVNPVIQNRPEYHYEENDVIGLEELTRVKAQLKWGKHTCLIMRMEHPRAYMIR